MTRSELGRRVIIAGVGYSDIARSSGRSEGFLTLQAARRALDDAGMGPDEVDGVVAYPDRVSSPFEGPSVTYVQRALGLERTRYWQALGWGPGQLSALVAAVYAVAGGGAGAVLCYRGHLRQERRYYVPGGTAGRQAGYDQAFRAPYGAPAGAPRFALWAQRYLYRYGRDEEDLCAAVLNNRANAQLNPRAIWKGSPLTREDYFAAPYISTPLRLLDCDMPVDGAVAIIVARADRAAGLPHKAVHVEAMAHGGPADIDFDSAPDLSQMASRQVGADLWSRTALGPGDVDVVEAYDGFSSLLLCWLEDLGFCEPGGAGSFLREGHGRVGRRLPVCTDGGQLGGGRLHGFGKVAEAVLQLREEGGARQTPGAEVAVASSGGGPLGSALLLTR
jgi:acetyl-CoA acetyltransferase